MESHATRYHEANTGDDLVGALPAAVQPRPDTPLNSARFATALSTRADAASAEAEARELLVQRFGGETPDLAVLFATHHHGEALERIGPRICEAIGARVVMGCTAESVIGEDREIEESPGLVLWAARLPETEIRFFQVKARPGDDDQVVFDSLPPVHDPKQAKALMVADPFSFPADRFLARLNDELPGVPVMGGMASGAMGPGQSLLFTADGARESGAVGVVLEGGVGLRPVVSQGCRPVGKPWVITACEQNVILKLGGRPALEVLVETWNTLPQGDQVLMQNAPFIGLAIDPTRSHFQRGDFLVRGVMGFDQKHQLIALAELVRRGQTVQFLVRDSASAGEDLSFLLSTQDTAIEPPEQAAEAADPGQTGALIFSCNGRGTRMFDSPNHDVSCVQSNLSGDVVTAGFFAAGEIGPVGGRNYLHGFTASVAVFR